MIYFLKTLQKVTVWKMDEISTQDDYSNKSLCQLFGRKNILSRNVLNFGDEYLQESRFKKS